MGKLSINKLVRIASIATTENEEEIAAMVKVLSKSALATWVRDVKYAQQDGGSSGRRMPCPGGTGELRRMPCPGGTGQIQMHISEDVDGLSKPPFAPKSLPGQNIKPACGEANFQLDEDVQKELNELNFKGIDVNQLLREMLKKRKEEIANIKQKLANEQEGKETTRHIPVKVERVLNLEYGTKCAVPNCMREARHIHHELPFAMVKNHNPFSMKPLCEGHHELAHSIDLKYQRMRKVTK